MTLARALINDPAIVWADEPTGSLDSQTAEEIVRLMRALNEQAGLTFVLVTHDPGVGGRCDRIVRMRDGRIVGEEERTPATDEAAAGAAIASCVAVEA